MPRSKKEHIWINKEGFVFHLSPGLFFTLYFDNNRIRYQINDDNPMVNGYEGTLENKNNRYDLPENLQPYEGQESIKITLFAMHDETISAYFDTWSPGED